MLHKKQNSKNTSSRTSRVRPKSRRNRGTHRKPAKIFTQDEADERMRDIFINHDFDRVSNDLRKQLAHFYQLLMNNQKTNNFTRLVSLRDVAIKHYMDCLMIPDLVDLKFPLLDIGTGPGFPGIPLKLLFPYDKIILAEGVLKRVEFLKEVRDKMGLENLGIVGQNIDEDFLLPVNGVITRALEDVPGTLKRVKNCLQKNGTVVFMKGPNADPEIQVAQKEFQDVYELVLNKHYTLSKTPNHRRIVVFKKIV